MTGLTHIGDIMPSVIREIGSADPVAEAANVLTGDAAGFDALQGAIDAIEDAFDRYPWRDRVEPEAADLDRQVLSGLRIELEALRLRIPYAAKRMAARLAREAAENDDDEPTPPPVASARVAA